MATLAAAELDAVRNERDVDRVMMTTRAGVGRIPLREPVRPGWLGVAADLGSDRGDYRGVDGWIRLHTNYRYHRAAVLRVLEMGEADRDEIEAKVAGWKVEDLESQVVDAGGVAAVMHSRAAWLAHPHGAATASALPVEIIPRADGDQGWLPPASDSTRGCQGA